MAKNNNQKIWGFVVVWLVLFLIVKSIEKLLLITAVGALIFWGSRALRANREKDDGRRKNNSLKEKDSER
ncbi:hypothetical protein [Arachidicoccus terrestris]|uniref:hypothetical protein n=1 Tax=Arachidicoccus terrestris TaxID=2875539 RepID=UPI001CC5AADD|nr:hypothetical protein [Arachidicoccus terrestris]UAY53832.1 hypothetical protein K9M52_10090 [Arachidicoccus terrestris]